MDPATARVVYAGCLVGSNPVPAGTPGAAIGGHLAGHRNLVTATEDAAAAHGIARGRTQGARASVALARRVVHGRAGNMAIQYPFDPNAYGDALTYVATGHEPEGLFRAAVEVAATAGPAGGRDPDADPAGHWGSPPDTSGSTRSSWPAIGVALDGVAPGSGVPAEKLNMLAHMVGPPFLVGNSEDGHGRTVATLVADVNSQPLAGDLYAADRLATVLPGPRATPRSATAVSSSSRPG